MTGAEPNELIQRYLTAYNRFDVDGMLDLLSPAVVFENFSAGELTASTRGLDQFAELARQSAAMFSEREQRVVGLSVRPESTAVDIMYRGRLAVDIPGGPTAGTILDLQGQSEFWFDDGLISKIVDRS